MNPYRLPFPDDDYLTAIGRVTYAIGYLEWSILGDLGHIPGLPDALNVNNLAGKTVGGIGKALLANSDQVEGRGTPRLDQSFRDTLLAFNSRRNEVLHARPATAKDGNQQLYRWTPKPGQQFFITPDLLEKLVRDIEDAVVRLGRVIKLD